MPAIAPDSVIRDVHNRYIAIIDDLFRNEINAFHESKQSVAQFITTWSEQGKAEPFQERIADISQRVTQFWSESANDLTRALAELSVLKSTVGSDIFPFRVQSQIIPVGCYVDTMVVQDYIRRMSMAPSGFSKRHAAFGLVAYALEIVKLRELLTVNLPIPPIVLLDHDILNEAGFRDLMVQRAQLAMRETVGELVGKTFATAKEAKAFLAAMKSVDEVCQAVGSPSYSLLEDRSGSFRKQFESSLVDTSQRIPGFADQPGEALWLLLLQNVSAANEHFIRSELIDATPLVHGDLEWEYILRRISEGKKLDLSATRGLQKGAANTGFLLRYVGPSQLLQLRKEGALADFRERLRNAIRTIEVSSAEDIENVVEAMNKELNAMLVEHRRELESYASSSKGFFGLKVAPMLGVMGLIVAGGVLGDVTLQTVGGIAGISGAPSIANVLASAKAQVARRQALKRSAAAILCKDLASDK